MSDTQISEANGLLSDYLDTQQLAVELNLAPITVIKWRQTGRGPSYTRIGKRIAYRRAAVRAWLLAREVNLSRPA